MQVDRRVRTAFVAGCVTLLVGGVGFRVAMAQLQVFLKKEPVPLREPLDRVPSSLGSWKQVGKDAVFSDALVEELGTRNYLDRTYAVDGDPSKGVMQVHAAYYTGMIDTVPHIPERCWNAGGMVMRGQPDVRTVAVDRSAWDLERGPVQPGTGIRYPTASVKDPVTRKTSVVNLPLGEVSMTVSVFQDPRNPKFTFLGGYLFIANGALTPSALAVRNLSFKLTDRYAYYCKVQFSARMPGEPDEVLPQFDRMTSELMTALLPHLMKCLPDWPSVEGATPPSVSDRTSSSARPTA
jgi:hypothetical protein